MGCTWVFATWKWNVLCFGLRLVRVFVWPRGAKEFFERWSWDGRVWSGYWKFLPKAKTYARIGGLFAKGTLRMWCSIEATSMEDSLSCQNMEGEGGEASLSYLRVETGRDGVIVVFRCSGWSWITRDNEVWKRLGSNCGIIGGDEGASGRMLVCGGGVRKEDWQRW
jgi:hypothetical protein